MAKRRADTDINHDNWDREDEQSEDVGGVFKRATDDELARRKIKVARRRGDAVLTGGSEGPSVFKNFTGFGSEASSNNNNTGSKLPSFDFGGKVPQFDGKKMFESVSFKLGVTTGSSTTSQVPNFNFTSTCNKENSEPSEKSKSSNGVPEESCSQSSDANLEGNNKAYLAHLKVLNEGVLKWIQKHLDDNININLNPVFDDYRKHFDELQKRYKPKFSKTGTSSSKSDSEQTTTTKNGEASPGKQTPLLSSSFNVNAASEISDSLVSTSTKTSNEKKAALFYFGSSDSKSKECTGFSFGPSDSKLKESSDSNSKKMVGFSFNTSDSSPKESVSSTLPFGSTDIKSKEIPTFSFGSMESKAKECNSSTNFSFGLTDSKVKDSAGFSFGGSSSSSSTLTFGAKDGGFSFGSKGPSTFSFAPTSAPPAATPSRPDEQDEDAPPKQEVLEVQEDGAFYQQKCKLFYKKDGVFTDKGVGRLFLKPAGEASRRTQLIVRAATALGNVLLNILLNASLPTQRMGSNNVLIVCVPNPPLDPKAEGKTPVTMLIRVKTAEDADELLKQIDQHKEQ